MDVVMRAAVLRVICLCITDFNAKPRTSFQFKFDNELLVHVVLLNGREPWSSECLLSLLLVQSKLIHVHYNRSCSYANRRATAYLK